MIIGLSGKAGSGKDTIGALLVATYRFKRTALADPLKQICKDVFDFSYEQCWGPSAKRNEPDHRYPRPLGYSYPDTPQGAVWIPLSKGGFTLISVSDFERVTAHSWRLHRKEAGKSTAYVSRDEGGHTIKLHTHLMGAQPEGMVIDHINGDGLDNRRENLRVCTHAQNSRNSKKHGAPGQASSPFKGVTRDESREKWTAKISVDGKTMNLGRFDSETAAALAYDEAAKTFYGEFARLNSNLFLTPRFALQELGTSWGRSCYEDIWITLGMRRARKLLAADPMQGDVPTGVVFTDVRFTNEIEGLKKEGAKLVRVKRGNGLTGNAALHASEVEQDSVPDSAFDYILDNTGPIEELDVKVALMMNTLRQQ